MKTAASLPAVLPLVRPAYSSTGTVTSRSCNSLCPVVVSIAKKKRHRKDLIEGGVGGGGGVRLKLCLGDVGEKRGGSCDNLCCGMCEDAGQLREEAEWVQ